MSFIGNLLRFPAGRKGQRLIKKMPDGRNQPPISPEEYDEKMKDRKKQLELDLQELDSIEKPTFQQNLKKRVKEIQLEFLEQERDDVDKTMRQWLEYNTVRHETQTGSRTSSAQSFVAGEHDVANKVMNQKWPLGSGVIVEFPEHTPEGVGRVKFEDIFAKPIPRQDQELPTSVEIIANWFKR